MSHQHAGVLVSCKEKAVRYGEEKLTDPYLFPRFSLIEQDCDRR